MAKAKADPPREAGKKYIGADRVAQALNLTPRRVQQLVDEGMPRESKGQYDLGKCMYWYIRFLQDALQRRELPDDEKAERLRLTKAKADRAELDLSVARGQLIPIEVFEERLSAMIMAARQQLLALPARIAPRLEGEDRSSIKSDLESELKHALTGLAKHGDNRASTRDTGTARGSRGKAVGPVGTTARSKNKRVGRKKPRTAKRRKRKARAVGN